jgi:hypothetical protein
MSIEAMKKVKQELEHIKQYGYATDIDHAIKTLRQAIEAAENPTHTDHPSRHWDRTCPACAAEAEKQEPVAWMYNGRLHECDPSDWAEGEVKPLYLAPPRKEWGGLTVDVTDLIQRAIEMERTTATAKREWVGLTDEEIDAIGYKYGAGGLELMNELTSQLKERNK